MKRFSFFSLRFQLFLIVLVAVIPALGVTIYSGLESRNQARLNALDDTQRLVQRISENHDYLIRNARRTLFMLSRLPQVRQQDKLTCIMIFHDVLKQSEGYTNLGAARPNGDVFASAFPFTNPVNFVDRPWFQRVLGTRDFVIGEYLIGRISGKPLITFAYPAIDDRGNLKAILFLGLDLSWLDGTIAKNSLPEGACISIVDSNGTILFRFPDPAKFVGKSIPEEPIVKAILEEEKGTKEMVGLDNIPRIFAYTSLGKGVESIHVSVGIPQKIAYAEADRLIKHNLVFVGIFIVLGFLAAWIWGNFSFLRPMERLLNMTERLAGGDFSARTGFSPHTGEIRRLAQAFDQMSESLQYREAARKGAEEELQKANTELEKRVEERTAALRETNELLQKEINERLRIEKDLRQQQQAQRGLLNATQDSIFLMDIEGTVITANETTARTLGKTLEEILGKCIFDFLPPHVLERLKRYLEEVFRTRRPSYFEEERQGIWLDQCVYPVLDEKGKVARVAIYARDITQRKLAEKLQHESEERYRLLAETAQDFIFIVDREGLILYSNKYMNEATFRADQKEMVGRRLTDLFPPETVKEQVGVLKAVLDSGKPIRGEMMASFPNQTLWTDYQLVPLLIENGEVRSVMGIARDINDKKQMQEKLLIAERLATLGLLSGSISHELKNPLSTIDSSIYYLRMKLRDSNEKVGAHLDRIKSSVDSAVGIIDNLRTLTQMKEPRRERLDLISVLCNSVDGAKIPPGVEVIKDLPGKGIRVDADSEQVRMAFMNIIQNAVQAMGGEGRLDVTVRKMNDQVEIAFSDTGPGIDPKDLEKIFQPLFSSKAKGMGLGLTIVKMIFERHKGAVEAKSEPGKGTTITARLPLPMDEPKEAKG